MEQVGNWGGTNRAWLTGRSPLMELTDAVCVVGAESQYGGRHHLFSWQDGDGSDGSGPTGPARRGRYLFAEDGLCRELETVERDVDGAADVTQVIEWSLSDVGGTSVDEPGWLDRVE